MDLKEKYYGKVFTESHIKKAIAKYVCTTIKGIRLNSIHFKILQVNGYRGYVPIKSWVDLLKLGKIPINPKSQPEQLEFIIEFIEDLTDNKNIKLVIQSVRQNLKKEKEKQQGKAKTWVPNIIPDFPLNNITHQTFWDYQTNKYSKQIQLAAFKAKDKSNSYTLKYKKNVNEEEITVLIIPKPLTRYFVNNGRKKEWKKFCEIIKKETGLSTIAQLHALLQLWNNIILDKIPEDDFVTSSVSFKLKLKTKEDIKIWKDDMLRFIGKYSNKTLHNFNVDGGFGELFNKGSFIYTLMKSEPKGVGRGEILLIYLLHGAKFAGGSQSYDIIISEDEVYEVKDYMNEIDPIGIRLGTEGKLSRREWWTNMVSTVLYARKVRSILGDNDLKELLADDEFFDVWKFITNKKSYTQYPKKTGTGIDAGELNKERLEILKYFYYSLNKFMIIFNEKNKEKFNKLSYNDIMNDKTGLAAINYFNSIKYVNNPKSLQPDLDNIGKDYAKSSGANKFIIFTKSGLSIGDVEDYIFYTITQGGVKICHKDASHLNSAMDKAAENWEKYVMDKFKNQSEKDYYTIHTEEQLKTYHEFYEDILCE